MKFSDYDPKPDSFDIHVDIPEHSLMAFDLESNEYFQFDLSKYRNDSQIKYNRVGIELSDNLVTSLFSRYAMDFYGKISDSSIDA